MNAYLDLMGSLVGRVLTITLRTGAEIHGEVLEAFCSGDGPPIVKLACEEQPGLGTVIVHSSAYVNLNEISSLCVPEGVESVDDTRTVAGVNPRAAG